MKRYAFPALLVLHVVLTTPGQVAPLDRYIEEGLKNSSTIRQEQAELRSATESLLEARSRFLPALWLKSRYTRADGGRSVTIPVGEMVLESFRDSPLGAMLSSSEPPDPVTITIMPETEQETKLQFIQPLFAPALVANHRLKSQLLAAREQALQSTALTLIRDIRFAYFTCLQAKEALTIYRAAIRRSERHRATARALVASGAANATAVAAAEAAHAKNLTSLERGKLDFTNACKALNLLCNRPLDAPPELSSPDSTEFSRLLDDTNPAVTYDSTTLVRRPEIAQLEAAAAASRSYISVEKSGFAPTLAAAFEGGIIGDRYDISDRTLFYTASVLFEWELFSGLGRMRKVRMATAALDKIIEQKHEATQKIRFQVEKSIDDLALARRVYRDSELQVTAAMKHHESVSRQFEQGLTTATELSEAGELLTKAHTARTVARYDLFKQEANLRYATAEDNVLLSSVLHTTGSDR